MKIFLVAAMGVLFIASCKKDAVGPPAPDKLEPGQGPANTVLRLTGSGLTDVHSIIFETGNVEAAFNPNFNTDGALIFRVPTDAVPGPQNIIFKNASGTEFSVPFNVLGLPTITDVSNYNFAPGAEITLTGKNLDDVSAVVFSGTTEAVPVTSKTATTVVLTMPNTNLNRGKLDITNQAGTITTSQEFVNMDKAFKFFTDGYAPGFQDASWGDPGAISTIVYKTGTASVGKSYAANNWHQLGFGWTNVSNDNYTYLTFWIKGCSQDYNLWISTSASVGGFASFEEPTKILVPANVWTYFKIPVLQLKLWANATSFNQIGWRIQGPNGQNETFYLDDVMLVK